MDFCKKKKIREIGLFDFTSFFGLDSLKFSGPHCVEIAKVWSIKRLIDKENPFIKLKFISIFLGTNASWLHDIRSKNQLL